MEVLVSQDAYDFLLAHGARTNATQEGEVVWGSGGVLGDDPFASEIFVRTATVGHEEVVHRVVMYCFERRQETLFTVGGHHTKNLEHLIRSKISEQQALVKEIKQVEELAIKHKLELHCDAKPYSDYRDLVKPGGNGDREQQFVLCGMEHVLRAESYVFNLADLGRFINFHEEMDSQGIHMTARKPGNSEYAKSYSKKVLLGEDTDPEKE
jgi:hypothetical protein